ncbi:MAG: ABC transporter substrate-binding protein, partial [Planctomycetota bacterium]
MNGLWPRLSRYPALLLLIIVYVISCGVVITNAYRGAGVVPGQERKKVLRIAHWQLEPGVREALEELAEDYQEIHPDVEIRQILVPEEGYFRWVNTQLIGRTAPDMIECGKGGNSPQAWPRFYARYFLPLDQYVDEPNPYNDGTIHEGVPWRQTFFDDMEGGYEDSLQAYYKVPLSTFTFRLFYNKDLIDEVWGPEFPKSYQEFLRLCEALQEYGRGSGKEFVPIACSGYNFFAPFDAYQTALTANYLDRMDTDFNGTVTKIESGSPLYSKATDLDEPPIRAVFELVRDLSRYFPQGYMSLGRDEAVFLFLQGHAAMIGTGTWDYRSLYVQADFPIGIVETPFPGKDDPTYGQYVAGRRTEAGLIGYTQIGITKMSKHPDVALDFLMFASSLEKNEQLNRDIYWLPSVADADIPEYMEPFAPLIEGYTPALQFDVPGAELAYNQTYPLYLAGNITWDDFVDQLWKAYRRELPAGVREE